MEERATSERRREREVKREKSAFAFQINVDDGR